MKKILTFALCLAAVGSMNAQKANVDAAKKLSGKLDKLEEARGLIKQAIENPETAKDAGTYSIAGKIEYDAFNEGLKKLMLNKDDASVDKAEMGRELINGFNYYIVAFPLDSVPNEKGQVKPKYSKEMASVISSHHSDYYNFGGELYNQKLFYPDAYNAFMIYGDIPSYPWATKEIKAIPDTVLAQAFYYAGISAYSGNQLKDALKALEKARKHGVTDPQSYVYEIASWQNLVANDSTLADASKAAIYDIALQGYQNFGMKQPLFINSLASTLVDDEKFAEAINLINDQLAANPDMSDLYSLRGWVLDRKGDDEAALADYRKSASYDDATVETLNRAARKLYIHGSQIWNSIEGPEPAKRQEVKTEYWDAAKALLERSLQLDPNNYDAENILDSVNYALETYFK